MSKKKVKAEILGLTRFIKGKKLNLSFLRMVEELLHLMDYKGNYFLSRIEDLILVHQGSSFRILIPSSILRSCQVDYRLCQHCSGVIHPLMWLVWLVQCIQCRVDECFSRKLPFLLIHTGHYCLPQLPHSKLVWSSSHISCVVLI